jgi:hypothetical protein
MNLPLALDVAIGLLFIYLTLSLLSSEIQELIGTILQWRAEHLKRSVDNLVTDKEFANRLYQSPLLRSLNQQDHGFLAGIFRGVGQLLRQAYDVLSSDPNPFGDQNSGPSYIPAETFAAALLQELQLKTISQKVSEAVVRHLSQEKLALIERMLEALRNSLGDNRLLRDEFDQLADNLEQILDDFASQRLGFSGAVEQAIAQLTYFIDNTEDLLVDNHHCKDIIRRQLPYLKQAIAQTQLEPTLTEILMLVLDLSDDGSLGDYSITPRLFDIVALLKQENPHLFQQIAALPTGLKKSLLALADRVQAGADSLESGVRQMEQEIATWFDNSMARASGVYKRNAKGVAIVIGFAIAAVINVDTIYITTRLAKDTTLRATISQSANELAVQTDAPEDVATDLQAVRVAVEDALDELPLPIGWGEVNVTQQMQGMNPVWGATRRALGWGITAIALSMGAGFWYDVLGKVMHVRNTGRSEGKRD